MVVNDLQIVRLLKDMHTYILFMSHTYTHATRLKVSASKKCVSAFLTDYEMNNITQVTDSKISPSTQTNQCHLFTGP